MKAIIKLDLPEYQIGQEVNIYFKDTMMIKGVVQESKTDILDKIRNEIDEQYDRVHPYNISCAEGLEMALGIIDKYNANKEDKE